MRRAILLFACTAVASPLAAQTVDANAQGQVTTDGVGTDEPEIVEFDVKQVRTIAVPSFVTDANVRTATGYDTATLGKMIAQVVASDLSASGVFAPVGPDGIRSISYSEVTSPQFGYWKGRNVEQLIQGFVRASGSNLIIGCYLYNVDFGSEQSRKGFEIVPGDWRRAAHKCADNLYSKLTGELPFFDSRVAYIAESGPKGARVKQLAIMDSDGANHRYLTTGQATALTPRFSPDYRSILYLSYLDGNPRIYVMDVASGAQRLLFQTTSPTFAPRWSPDGQSILFSMATAGNTDIYRLSTQGGQPERLTNAPGIDVGGSFSPDGSKIVFESDRSGSQQLYVMDADGSNVKRISFGSGRYATPEWSPRGDLIAFTKIAGNFRVGVMRPDGSGERLLTDNWQDEAPTFAPNGRVIQFFRTEKGSGETGIWQVDLTGANERKLPTPRNGSDPAWGPIRE